MLKVDFLFDQSPDAILDFIRQSLQGMDYLRLRAHHDLVPIFRLFDPQVFLFKSLNNLVSIDKTGRKNTV